MKYSMPRELKMTTVCKTCSHQYGVWRDRCPTCGTSTPRAVVETFNAPRRVARAKQERKRSPHECILCRTRGARHERCPHCNEAIHKGCLRLHVAPCALFQEERRAAEASLVTK